MAIQPIPNVLSQLDRALCAYLIANGCGVWSRKEPADCVISPGDGLIIKSYPNLVVLSRSSSHDPQPTGIEKADVSFTLKFSLSGTQQSGNPYAARVARDALIGLILACMLQTNDNATLYATAQAITAAGRALATQGSDQEQQNNADMVNFTCLSVYYNGTKARGEPDEIGCDWVDIKGFTISACPSAIDMDN